MAPVVDTLLLLLMMVGVFLNSKYPLGGLKETVTSF
jgi:hypothetical protein